MKKISWFLQTIPKPILTVMETICVIVLVLLVPRACDEVKKNIDATNMKQTEFKK